MGVWYSEMAFSADPPLGTALAPAAATATWCRGLGFEVSGFGFRALSSGFRGSSSGFMAAGFGPRALGFEVSNLVFRGSDSGFRASGLGLHVAGFGFRISESLPSCRASLPEVLRVSPMRPCLRLGVGGWGSGDFLKLFGGTPGNPGF